MFLANHNTTSVTDPSLTDPYWKEVVYYARFDNTLLQDETGINTVTANASAVRTTANSKFGGASFAKPAGGTGPTGGSWLTIAGANNTQFAFGTGDFTIEYWVNFQQTYPGSGNYAAFCVNRLINGAEGGTWIAIQGPAVAGQGTWRMGFYNGASSGGLFAVHPTHMTQQNWYHFACCRVSGTVLAFVDGAMATLGTMSRSIGTSGGTFMATDYYNEYNYSALYDDIRVTKGVARYTQSFAPPVKAHPTPTLR
jgi:hypothetical protein